MGQFRVYIKPFTEDGVYDADFTEVTKDVDLGSIARIAQNLDNTEYDIGVYRNTTFTLKLNNLSGRYSDVDVLQSIFKYKRTDSLVKVTWDFATDEGALCGQSFTGSSFTSEEATIFLGLLNDESFQMDLGTQFVDFQVLGREAIFQRITVPFSSIANGDLISAVIKDCLNQTEITDLLTYSAANIVPGTDVILDDVSGLENKTVREALNELLLLSNSVLYIEDDAIKVTSRDGDATVSFHFYGQASQAGLENIQDVKAIRNGLNRVFNYFVWDTSGTLSQDSSSAAIYKIRKKTISSELITNTTRQQTVLDALIDEFSEKKIEFNLSTPITYDTLDLNLNDRIDIDYPTVYFSSETGLPICGIAVCGVGVLPRGQWSFTLDPSTNFKISGKSVDPKKHLITFNMREI